MEPPKQQEHNPQNKVLSCGLGGGLDVVNAALLYFAFKSAKIPVRLGSIRPTPFSTISNHEPFSKSGTTVGGDTIIKYHGRYAEPKIAKYLGEDVLLFSRNEENYDKKNPASFKVYICCVANIVFNQCNV